MLMSLGQRSLKQSPPPRSASKGCGWGAAHSFRMHNTVAFVARNVFGRSLPLASKNPLAAPGKPSAPRLGKTVWQRARPRTLEVSNAGLPAALLAAGTTGTPAANMSGSTLKTTSRMRTASLHRSVQFECTVHQQALEASVGRSTPWFNTMLSGRAAGALKVCDQESYGSPASSRRLNFGSMYFAQRTKLAPWHLNTNCCKTYRHEQQKFATMYKSPQASGKKNCWVYRKGTIYFPVHLVFNGVTSAAFFMFSMLPVNKTTLSPSSVSLIWSGIVSHSLLHQGNESARHPTLKKLNQGTAEVPKSTLSTVPVQRRDIWALVPGPANRAGIPS